MNKHEKQYGHWQGDHPYYVLDDWKYEVANGDTRLGYWEWVASQAEQDERIEKDRQDQDAFDRARAKILGIDFIERGQ